MNATYINLPSAKKQFHDFLIMHNHPLNSEINEDTTSFHYFQCPHGESTDARYIFYSDGIPSAYFKCWHCDIEESFCSLNKDDVSENQWQDHLKKMEYRRREEIEKRAKEQEIYATQIESKWLEATTLSKTINVPYLLNKKINNEYFTYEQIMSWGLRHDGENLYIPLRDIHQKIWNIETIYPDHNKLPTKGCRVDGLFHLFGQINPNGVLQLSEGICTAIIAYECSGKIPTACCRNANNLIKVAQAIKTMHPNIKFKICTDDDRFKKEKNEREARNLGNPRVFKNAGLEASQAIKQVFHAEVVKPDFSIIGSEEECLQMTKSPSDFHDIWFSLLIKGRDLIEVNEEIKRQLLTTISRIIPLPLPDALPPVIPFNLEMLPKLIRDYVEDITMRQQCPIDFVAVTAICALAALLGRKAYICPKQYDDWTVTPNLWGAIIGRPSAMKSPSMKAALSPLFSLEVALNEQYEAEKEDYDIDKKLFELEKESQEKAVKQLIKNGQKNEARATLKSSSFVNSYPSRKRIIVNDATVEKLGELLNENPNGLILIRDELSGWLAKLAKEEYQTDRAFYLECFDGNGRYTYDRIGRGTIMIENCTLSVIGGIQPSKISPLIRNAIQGTTDDGLVQRLQLAVWPDDIGNWKWIDQAPNKEARNNYQSTFDYLHNLTFDTPDGKLPSLRFTNKAQELFIKWSEENRKDARREDIHSALESYLLKLPQTIVSLALLFEIIDGGKEHVGEEATARALSWSAYLKSHAERLYSIAATQEIIGANLIIKRKSKLESPFTARMIQRKQWTGLDDKDIIKRALGCLVDYKHLTAEVIPPTIRGGAPTTQYWWNKEEP